MELTEEKVKSLGLDTQEEIVIPKDIKVIKRETFEYSTKIRKIIMNEGLEIIGHRAFGGCKSLEEVILPNSLKSIEDWVFSDLL